MIPTPRQILDAALAVLNGAALTYDGAPVVFETTWTGKRKPEEFASLVAELVFSGFGSEIDADNDAIAEPALTVILRHQVDQDAAQTDQLLDEMVRVVIQAGFVLINTQLAVGDEEFSPERVETATPIIDPADLIETGLAEAAATVTYRLYGAAA